MHLDIVTLCVLKRPVCFGYNEEPLLRLVCRCCVSPQLSAGFLKLLLDHTCMSFRTRLNGAFEWQGA